MNRFARAILLLSIIPVGFALAQSGTAQPGTANGEWRYYGGDAESTKYSPLDQINRDNVGKLQVAWTWKAQNFGPRADPNYEVTPLMVHGVIYCTGGTRRAAFALDAATGELLWIHSENEGPRGQNAPRQLSGHGLAYWTDGKEERILYVTPGYRLVALRLEAFKLELRLRFCAAGVGWILVLDPGCGRIDGLFARIAILPIVGSICKFA